MPKENGKCSDTQDTLSIQIRLCYIGHFGIFGKL